MNPIDQEYHNLCKRILDEGVMSDNRTGVRTLSIFGAQIKFNMADGFPLLTTKKMYVKGIIHELLWFLQGNTNIKYLVDNDVNIWNADAHREYTKHTHDAHIIRENRGDVKIETRPRLPLTLEEFTALVKSDAEFAKQYGELGPVYGKQWVDWNGINQIQNVINTLKKNPDSRRIMVTAWNPNDVDRVVLPPCHYFFQLNTRMLSAEEKEKNPGMERAVSLMWNQRSCDHFLGVPFNIASYGFLLHMIAQQVNMLPDKLIGSLGNVHFYENHIDAVKEQLSRDSKGPAPLLNLNSAQDIFSYKYEDFTIVNYDAHPSVKGKLVVG